MLEPRANVTSLPFATGPHLIHGTHSELVMFYILNVFPSHLGLPVLLGVVLFSKRVSRHITFVNFGLTFIIVGISSSLLLYAGKTTGPEPSIVLCLLQASLVYGMPPLTSTAALALVIQMFLVIRSAYFGEEYREDDHVFRRWLMIVSPYVWYFITIIATSVIGSQDPRRVSRDRRFFYCSVDFLPLTDTITFFAGVVLLVALALVGWTAMMIVKQWMAINRNPSQLGWRIELSLPLRIIGFGIYLIGATSLSFISLSSPSSPVPDLFISTASTAFLLIFGSQADVLSVVFLRNRGPPVRPVTKQEEVVNLDTEFSGKQT